MKINIFLILSVLVLSSMVCAQDVYQSLGGSDEDFHSVTGGSRWGAHFTGFVSPWPNAPVSDGVGSPYVADLDGDGVKEIIFNDGGTVSIYNYSKDKNSFFPVDFNSISSGGVYSNIEIMDFDSDGLLDIIIADSILSELVFMEYNGTHLNTTDKVSLTNRSVSVRYQVMIRCPIAGECVVVKHSKQAAANFQVMIQLVNSDEVLDSEDVHSNGELKAIPHLGKISYENYDPAGINEDAYIFSYAVAGATESVFLDSWTSNGTEIVRRRHISETLFDIDPGYFNTWQTLQYAFTSPLVVDTSTDTGMEWWIAFNTDGSNPDYKLFVYEVLDDNPMDDFPELSEVDGYIISAPFIANAIGSETAFPEVCVMSHETSDQVFTSLAPLVVLCGSTYDAEDFVEHRKFVHYSTLQFVNLSLDTDIFNEMAHSFDSNLQGTINYDEVLTPFGVWSLNRESCYFGLIAANWGTCDLDDEGVAFGDIDQALIPIDYDDDGLDDIIGLTENNLYFYDDQEIDLGAWIDFWEICPSHDGGIWNTSTDVRLTMDAYDRDLDTFGKEGDNMSIRMTIYDGHSNNQSTGWRNQSLSDISTETFWAKGNVSISQGKIVFEARDGGNGEVFQVIKYFSASSSGTWVYGDACSSEVLSPVPVVPVPVDPDAAVVTDEDIIDQVMPGVPVAYRFMMGLFILVIISVLLVLWLNSQRAEASVIIYSTLSANFIGWIFFVALGVFPGWTVVVFLIFGALILGWRFYPSVSGG